MLFFCLLMLLQVSYCYSQKIDRKALVLRNQPMINGIDTMAPLSVGNGKFAFTADFTGLQTFFNIYENGIPLGTQSDWGWHSFPNSNSYRYEETLKEFDFHNRKIPYDVEPVEPKQNREASVFFRQNLHRMHLGMVGFDFIHEDGSSVKASEIKMIKQTLNPWNGKIHSVFTIDNSVVEVVTYAHQQLDMISTEVHSELLKKGQIRIRLRFPYPSGKHTDSGCDWNQPDRHQSILTKGASGYAEIRRQLDSTEYFVKLKWKGKAMAEKQKDHDFMLVPAKGLDHFSFSCMFSAEEPVMDLPGFNETAQDNALTWEAFWSTGGAVDFTGSTDPRARELERRIILSRYLTKIQCAGLYPPQETGLTFNSWFGKFHMEMHWWHGAHFALWDHEELLKNSMEYYGSIEENARLIASRQGFKGVRWPKMTDPTGFDSPSNVGAFLIWQQPHFIYLAELCYRNNNDKAILEAYADLVYATADFMASYAWYDSINNRYVLGPTLIPAQERFPAATTINPPFELSYWHWGLETALKWKERLGQPKVEAWEKVLNHLSAFPRNDSLYLAAESAPDSYTNPLYMTDHPMTAGTFGMLPGNGLLDTALMKATFDYTWKNWHWKDTWGWDFPMIAMAATRLGMPDKAIDALFMEVPTNTYLTNGHNYQNDRLKIYLPGNGGLLTAISMMCAGYDGATISEPGFPKDGTWKVSWEGLKPLP